MSNSSGSSNEWSFETKAVHSGQECEQWKNLEMVPPIVTSMTYYQNDPSKMNVRIGLERFILSHIFLLLSLICFII